MTAVQQVYLWCNGRNEPRPGSDHRPVCGNKFEARPELGYPTVSVVRKEAKKAGWTFIRHPSGLRSLDKDLCPDHPEQGG